MSFVRRHRAKAVFALLVAIIAGVGIFIWQKYPFGVKQYYTIKLGMPAAEGAGSRTLWKEPLFNKVWESQFYVYVINDIPKCIGSSCELGGKFIECLGGWISAYNIVTEEFDYGLRDAGADMRKSVITIADKDAKIVGIYPGARVKNLPYIMRNHRDLVSEEVFNGCSGELPGRWK
ncbi:hypothetical protein EPN28_03885 [Patescibacteria group bacterium]|nr:MAG: hypothetical protein EPN28_03885 [Patescibacteria group bacterium]